MSGGVAAVAGVVVVAVVGLVLCGLLVHLTLLVRGLRREVGSLRGELDALRRERPTSPPPSPRPAPPTVDTVARTVPLDGPVEPSPDTVPDRVVVSATLGEPLIKVAALGHGVRRALAEDKRAHIGYQMRRELRRRRRRARAARNAAARAPWGGHP